MATSQRIIKSVPAFVKADETEREAHTALGKIYRVNSMLRILKIYAEWGFKVDADAERFSLDIQNQLDQIRCALLGVEQYFDPSATRLDDEHEEEA
jgi:hypothetical protein